MSFFVCLDTSNEKETEKENSSESERRSSGKTEKIRLTIGFKLLIVLHSQTTTL